jgi:hypothetical protein
MTTCSESGQVRKEAAIRSLCRASESIERTGFLFARFYQTAQCLTLRATQSDNLSFKRQGMTRRSMPCLFHANLFALGGARWLCQNIDGYVLQEAMKCLVSRWSSASPAGSLDYQAPCRHSQVADQNRLKGHIYLIIESLALCRSLALPKHRLLRALGASGRCPYICNELLTHLQGSPYYHESD